MSFPQKSTLSVVTDGAGAYSGVFPSTIRGRIKQIVYTKTDFSNGSTITLTNQETGETIWGETGVNASAVRAPRIPTHSTAGAAALYAAGGVAVNDDFYCANDHVLVTISSAGATKSGKFDIIYE